MAWDMRAGMNRYYQGPPSDHFDGERFFNPGHPATDRGLRDMLRWKLGEKAARWPSTVEVRLTAPEPRVAGTSVTAVGHATLLIQLGGLNLLTDPVWSERASPTQWFGPKRVTAPGIAFDKLPPIDAVLLSHNHYDHLDLITLARLVREHDPLIVTPLGNDAIVHRAIPAARVITGDWGDKVDLQGVEIHVVPAQHWSSRGLSDRRMALWGGFMLRSRAATIYFAGDTGYGDGAIFRTIRERHGAPDLALIPIVADEPRWFMAAQHVNPEEAVQIMLDLDAKRAIGIHWGTFQLTDEPRDAPVIALAESLARQGIDPARFQAAVPGEVY